MSALCQKLTSSCPTIYRWKLLVPPMGSVGGPAGDPPRPARRLRERGRVGARLRHCRCADAARRGSYGGGKPMSKIPQEQVHGVSHRRVGEIARSATASSTAGSTCCATSIRRRGASWPNPSGRHGARPSTRSSSIRPGAWRWSRPAPAITSGHRRQGNREHRRRRR